MSFYGMDARVQAHRDRGIASRRMRDTSRDRGWRRVLRLATFGLINLGPSPAQQQEAQFEAAIRIFQQSGQTESELKAQVRRLHQVT